MSKLNDANYNVLQAARIISNSRPKLDKFDQTFLDTDVKQRTDNTRIQRVWKRFSDSYINDFPAKY